jgi:protocatechuate 3,4-dioxygenase beta subunit
VVAGYSGDANYQAVTGACGAAGETEVVHAVSPIFTADTPPLTGKAGTPYASYTFVASGNPKPTYGLTAGSLPTGLTLNGSSGVLAGTPSAPGSFTFTVGATNGSGTDASSGPITIVIAAGPTQITGRVTNAAGTALANICVYPYAAGATGARTADAGTCTDATGSYALNIAAAGSYNVAFFDPTATYVTQWANGQPSEAAANPVVVTTGAQTTGVNARMTGVTQITGTVTNSSSTPVANVCVYLYGAGATGARTSDPGACTNSAGQYTMHVAAAGSYNVAFFDPSGTYVTQWSRGQASEATANPVVVTAGATTTGVNAALTGVTRIVGTVTNTSGTPLSNICVYLYAAGATGARTSDTGVCTNAAGGYSMPVAAAGSYNVAFFDPSGTHATVWANGHPSEATANPVAVTSGAQTVVNATLAP